MITSAPWVLTANSNAFKRHFRFRRPTINDGNRIHALIANCPPLDTNSAYCNFLQASHFSDTCVVAEFDGAIAGFISAYLKPQSTTPNTLFIWQVAVDDKHRGQGLAYQMLNELLSRCSGMNIEYVETTITKDNKGSWALFKKLDRENSGDGEVSIFLDQTQHFYGDHDTEYLFRIPLRNTYK
ncbi:diaminobutyrate acetyltransferase [Vibrio renipiscarius]|nr:diaminobutyrate acetyltransferase [Vibrio renipiscarius]